MGEDPINNYIRAWSMFPDIWHSSAIIRSGSQEVLQSSETAAKLPFIIRDKSQLKYVFIIRDARGRACSRKMIKLCTFQVSFESTELAVMDIMFCG